MKELMKTGLVAAAALVSCAAFAAETKPAHTPAEWIVKARKQFAEQRFGIFIHWGLYANYAQGEWYLYNGKLNEAAYSRMMHGFYPSKFDAKEWVRIFKDAGAKYVTITSRHHDGFSLWHTKVDDGYNIANTPFKRDILAELSAACQAEGLQLNLYYSLMDWHRPDYFFNSNIVERIQLPVERKPDYPAYKKFMLAQIGELIENFKPGNIWFDGEWNDYKNDWQLEDIYSFIHSKKVLVANNNHKAPRDSEDIQLFERDLPGVGTSFSKDQPVYQDRPIEQCDVIQDNVWGYRIGETKFRTAEDVVAMVARAAAKGANLLMNIGPDGSGQLPERAVTVMKDVGVWFRKNGEAIYKTDACPLADGSAVVTTRRGNIVYVHFLDPAKTSFTVDTTDAIASATYLETGKPAKVSRDAKGKPVVTIERAACNKFDVVVKLVLK